MLEEPQAIFKDNVKDVIDDGFWTAADICTAELRRRLHRGRHPASSRPAARRAARRAAGARPTRRPPEVP